MQSTESAVGRDWFAGCMTALFGFGLLGGCADDAPKQSAKPIPEVEISRVEGATSDDIVDAVGTVRWRREVALAFTSPGRIDSIAVNEGDNVRWGALLAAIDTSTVSATLAAAKAELDRAELEHNRNVTLLRSGWITKARAESSRAALRSAVAEVNAARFQTRNAVINAPDAGVVLARLAETGQVVAAGSAVILFGERSKGFVARLQVADTDVARLRVGAPASVELAGLGRRLTGNIVEIGGQSDQSNGMFTVEVSLPFDPALRSGQVAIASITTTGGSGQMVVVPPQAVFAPKGNQALVFVVDLRSKRVRTRHVTVERIKDEETRFTGGIAIGEWVATSRIDRLSDGMLINPIKR